MTKSKIISLPDLKEIEREATLWFVKLEGEGLSPEDQADFNTWYNQSPVHQDALERMSDFWGGLSALQELKDFAANVEVIAEVKKDKNRYRTQLLGRALAGTLAASLIILCGVGVTRLISNPDLSYTASFQTGVGEQKTVDLPDGSQIILNTDSSFDVVFSEQNRDIILTKGEAFFEVASDDTKPFSVATDNGVVTAVGTAFSVRVHDAKIDVLVTEGRVALTAIEPELKLKADPTSIAPQAIEVSAGQSVVFAQRANKIDVIPPVQLEKEVDWHDGMLAFKGETLESVIHEIERYTDIQIEIVGKELRQQKIVAYYRIGNIDEMFEALNLMAGVEVEQVADQHVRLYRLD